MTAPAHPMPDRSRNHRPAPAAALPRRTHDASQTRLPWWGALLPVVGFALLLVLLVGGGQADAAQRAADSPLLSFLTHLWGSVLG
ncbi:hypothetical protein [Streptomyces sp. NPDC007063]|uniref:hypothetical protein n=1 Tax=Streptomyces sp. NPDC007063 TaxID=3364772 RepID=UPI00369EDD7A